MIFATTNFTYFNPSILTFISVKPNTHTLPPSISLQPYLHPANMVTYTDVLQPNDYNTSGDNRIFVTSIQFESRAERRLIEASRRSRGFMTRRGKSRLDNVRQQWEEDAKSRAYSQDNEGNPLGLVSIQWTCSSLLGANAQPLQSRQPSEFICKTLTASDTRTHGGFSVPRRAAEKIFPALDFSMQPPAQELMAKDLHDSAWTFRHIYQGQPKRHLLTTGWSVFVSTKRLFAGDAVLLIRDEKSQLLLGIRRANRQQPALSSSVVSSDSMHIGILAAVTHAAANNTPFTIYYNPRTSPSEFVVPLAKYNKAMSPKFHLACDSE